MNGSGLTIVHKMIVEGNQITVTNNNNDIISIINSTIGTTGRVLLEIRRGL